MSYGNLHLPTSEAEDAIWNSDIAPARSNTITKDCVKEDQRHIPPTSALDQTSETLLRALRNVIIPLAHSAGVVIRNDEVSDGPEGEEFLIALQKYITFIIRPQSRHQAGITINLEDSPLDTFPAEATVRTQNELGFDLQDEDRSVFCNAKESLATATQAEEDKSMMLSDSNGEGDGLEYPLQLTPLERIREGLRECVFNTMPMRMLSFNTHGTQFTITLIERGAYFASILPELEVRFDEEQFFADVCDEKESVGTSARAEYVIIGRWVSRFTQYAILSHTWLRGTSGEVTYGEWNKGGLDASRPGYQKLVNFCRVAAADHGVTLGWMDTVCINKESSAELDESIRSMYKWYQKAKICITYLAQTVDLANMHKDPWFSRGWTLQELLAPRRVKFYRKDWKLLTKAPSNDKRDPNIQHEIKLATTMTDRELQCLTFSSMSRRMQWAAMREVTREEDAAYSLMGIFDVSITIAYGEGAQQAFFRLLKEILNSSRVHALEIFYWAGSYTGTMSSLLPSSPKAYLHNAPTGPGNLFLDIPIKPLMLTHLGLRVPVLLMPAGLSHNPDLPYVPVGDYYATVDISSPVGDGNFHFTYNVLDSTISEVPNSPRRLHGDWDKVAFGVLNFRGDENTIYIPSTCFAVALSYIEGGGRANALGSVDKMKTRAPVVFPLRHLESDTVHNTLFWYPVPKVQLGHHGIQLLNLYL